jgi:hypothetical protein
MWIRQVETREEREDEPPEEEIDPSWRTERRLAALLRDRKKAGEGGKAETGE